MHLIAGCATSRRALELRQQAGFTLIEVMVTVLVLSVGLLGVAKLQAASMSSTQVSRLRSLLALQAGSLAAAMHANPGYWASGLAPTAFTIAGATVTDSTGVLNVSLPTGACMGSGTACTPAQIAALDVQTWAINLNIQMPSYSGTVTCTTTLPVGCQIAMKWAEKYVATNATTATGATVGNATFSMFVAP